MYFFSQKPREGINGIVVDPFVQQAWSVYSVLCTILNPGTKDLHGGVELCRGGGGGGWGRGLSSEVVAFELAAEERVGMK